MTVENILLTGANRGLGLMFTKSYLASGANVYACARNCATATELQALKQAYPAQLHLFDYDVANSSQLQALVEQLRTVPLNRVIANAGVYGGRGQVLGNIDVDTWLETLRINCIAPFELIEAFVPNLTKAEHKTAAVISSKMGSIDDNGSGGSYIYRSSKTALNSVVKSLSIDLREHGIRVLAMHPGWVRTDMGGPNGLIDVETSIKGMRQTIDANDLNDSGKFFNYDGSEIAW